MNLKDIAVVFCLQKKKLMENLANYYYEMECASDREEPSADPEQIRHLDRTSQTRRRGEA